MKFKQLTWYCTVFLLFLSLTNYSNAQTITNNKVGKQGDYHYEYWKDGGTGTMVLGDGCDFSCNWGSVNNILFRKGLRPGSKDQIVIYTADYKPQGNSYLSIYGWFQNPLVEYYIIESWGTWKPPGVAAKGSVEVDGATYDIYQNSRTGASIEGNKTFQQYWSVRRSKRTSGTIHVGHHFAAWQKQNMTLGKQYEVSFNVEAYQSSGGQADVKITMTDSAHYTSIANPQARASKTLAERSELGRINVTAGGLQKINFLLPAKKHLSLKLYNILGREVADLGKKMYSAGTHSVSFDASKLTDGVYYYTVKADER